MDLISHIIFAFLLARQNLLVVPLYVSLPLLFGAVLPDLDRLYSYSRKRYGKAESRTFMQEMPFLSVMVAVGFLLGQPLFSLGIISHILLDFISGETRPFYPLSEKKMDFNIHLKYKFVIGALIWVIGAMYIAGWIGF